MFWSKTSSGEVRESAQPTMIANGCWVWAVSARRAAVGLPLLTGLATKRALPALSRARATSGLTEGGRSLATAALPASSNRQAATIRVKSVRKRMMNLLVGVWNVESETLKL